MTRVSEVVPNLSGTMGGQEEEGGFELRSEGYFQAVSAQFHDELRCMLSVSCVLENQVIKP